MGSTSFATLFLTIGILTNLLYVPVAFILDTILGQQYFFLLPTFGIWIVLFGVIAMECSNAPQGSMRKLFVFTVPTIYYPLALLGIFCFIGGFSINYLISIGVGYGFGLGYLDRLKVSNTRCKNWEETFLESLTHQDGWVAANGALGSPAWSEEEMLEGGGFGNMLSRLTLPTQQQQQQQQQRQSQTSLIDEDSRPGRIIKPNPKSTSADINNMSSTTTTLPTTGGRQLGGPSRRTNTEDPRQARLKAIERRMGGPSNEV